MRPQQQKTQIIDYGYDDRQTWDDTREEGGQLQGTMRNQLAKIHGRASVEHPGYGDTEWVVVTTNELAEITRMTTSRQYIPGRKPRQGGSPVVGCALAALAVGGLMFIFMVMMVLSSPQVLALLERVK